MHLSFDIAPGLPERRILSLNLPMYKCEEPGSDRNYLSGRSGMVIARRVITLPGRAGSCESELGTGIYGQTNGLIHPISRPVGDPYSLCERSHEIRSTAEDTC